MRCNNRVFKSIRFAVSVMCRDNTSIRKTRLEQTEENEVVTVEITKLESTPGADEKERKP